MPVKKKYNILVRQQKRIIATRLIEISLLVDDYLYQQKLISQSSANAYIREITTYKDKCYQDVRSLQVIEKLTRCMKGIIDEQQELHDAYGMEVDNVVPNYESSKNETNFMLSPVYSTTDEDLTQLPQYLEAEKSIFNEQNDIETDSSDDKAVRFNDKPTREVNSEKNILGSAFEAIETYPINNYTGHFYEKSQTRYEETRQYDSDIEVIDLCDDEKDEVSQKKSYEFHHEPELTIQKGISGLSIRDNEETFTPFSQECSQSILSNFDPKCNSNYHPRNVIVPLTQDYDDIIRTAAISQRKPETDKVLFKKIYTKMPVKQQDINTQISAANKPVTINTHKMQKVPNDAERAKTFKPRAKNATNAKNSNKNKTTGPSEIATACVQNKKSAKVTNRKVQTKKQKNAKANQKTKQPTQQEVQGTITTRTLNSMQYPNLNDQPLTYQQLEHSERNKHFKAHKNRKDMPNIYSRAVVNDLSWIEKIRFVREITSEEYESFTVGEEFWENYSLPEHWNEEDFNY